MKFPQEIAKIVANVIRAKEKQEFRREPSKIRSAQAWANPD